MPDQDPGLDERERQVVMLLRSGITKVGEVASALGIQEPQPGVQAPGADPPERPETTSEYCN